MMNITLHNADDKQVALQAYSVALTNEINSYPTVNFMFNATGHNALVEDMLDEGSYFDIDGQQYRFESSNPVPNSRFRTYTIDATHIGVMLEDNFIRETVKGKQSLDALAKLMISDLKGWSYKIDDKFDDVDLGDDETEKGHGKAILDLIVEKFGCEYWFDNRCIHFCKTVGKGENNASFLFVDQMNASHIAFTEDFTNFKTAIHAYGKQIEVETGGGVGDFGEGPTEPVNGDWGPVIRYAAQLMDVPIGDSGVNLVKAQIKLESGGNEQILGGDDGLADGRATGLLQYKPGTFNNYAVEGHKNILSGFDQLLAFFNIPNALGQISGTHGWSPHGAPRSRTIIKQPAKSGGWGWPFPNNKSYTLGVGYKFGYDGGFRQNSYHDGTDWSSGTYSGDVHAIHSGVVTLVDGYNFGTGSGRIVVRGDDGYTVVYQEWTWAGSSGAHVSVGQRINIGDVICTLQASHVHIGVTTKDFATAFSNSFSNAGGWVDPIPLIQKGGSSASPAVASQPTTQTQSRAQEVIAYAERYVGQPYKWGGPRGVDQIVPTDCSGMTSNIYKHFGITIGGVTYTQATCGRRISRSEVQTGDLGFYDPGCHHVVMALDNKRAIQEPQPGQNCNIFTIDSYAPTYWIRNDQMAALVAGGGNAGGADGDAGGEKQMVYSCETDYISPLAKKVNIGERWADPIESDTITDEAQLKEWAKSQLHDYPDVEYSVDWISFKENVGGFVNDASLGNYGWLRDRYGLDVKVRIKGYTRYADESDPSNADSITFGNGAKALRDINSMLIGDLKPVKQAATKTNDKVSNGLRISATNQEWINSQLALTGGF